MRIVPTFLEYLKMTRIPRRRSTIRRTYHIDTRLTKQEFDTIKFKAAATGVSASEYLRSLGCNYPLKSMVDQLAVDELIQARSDLGRVGGLFKKWLSEQEGRSGKIGSKNYKEVDDLVLDLESKQEILLDAAKQLLKSSK